MHAFLAVAADPYVGYRVGDEVRFHDWALAISRGNLLRGEPYFTSPLYAYVLGFWYRVAGDGILPATALNMALGLATAGLVFLTAKALAGRAAAAAAMALAGLCLAPVFYELFTEKTALTLFLTALAAFLVSRSVRDGRPSDWALAGAAIGLGALAHPLLLVMLPAAMLHRPQVAGSGGRRTRSSLALFLGCALLALVPATAHNFVTAGDFVLICTNGGESFYVGNHAANSSGLYTSPSFSSASLESEERAFAAEAERRGGKTLRPSEVSAFWFRQGLREVAAEPRLSLLRFSRKLRWALGDEEITDTRNIAFYRERLAPLRLPLLGFGAVSFLGLTGAALLARERAARFLLFFALFYLVSLSLFFVYGRYRLPLLVPFSILAGAGIARAGRLAADRRASEMLRIIPVALLAFWLSFAKVLPGTGESFFVDYFNRGNHLLAEGDLDAAIREFEQALWVRPGNHPATRTAILRLADLYVLRGKPAAAEDLLQRARAAGRLSFPDRTGPR